jgi:hypothetical protein
VLVLAVNVNGDDSTAPLEGVTTVMADAGMDDPTNNKSARMRFFMDIPQIRMASKREGQIMCFTIEQED